jgi:hypothetical protein
MEGKVPVLVLREGIRASIQQFLEDHILEQGNKSGL